MYDRSSTKKKWTIMKYMNGFELMVTYAYALRSSNELNDENIENILIDMERKNIYHPRYGGSIDTGKFKIIQIAWYLFGYYDNTSRKRGPKKFVFSPLGNLLLDNISDKGRVSRIFLAMLYGITFKNPFSKMSNEINIYPFRLIFNLLLDDRINNTLYDDEVFYFVMFCKTIDSDSYEELIKDILQFRTLSPEAKLELFKKDESVVAQALHEWTYVAKLLDGANICRYTKGSAAGLLVHGNGTGRRRYKLSHLKLDRKIKEFCTTLNDSYNCFESPYSPEILSNSFSNDMVINFYSFYPVELLSELGIENDEQIKISNLLQIATKFNEYARNTNKNDHQRFETALSDTLNLFSDVQAQNVGGAGSTDIECMYYSASPEVVVKFDVEAKARRAKLLEISSGRLRLHRTLINSNYTIIVTPDFAPAVLEDIKNDNSVILKASTLSNYMYQYISRNGRNISYDELNDIIISNLGEDITSYLIESIYDNFGHSSNVSKKVISK